MPTSVNGHFLFSHQTVPCRKGGARPHRVGRGGRATPCWKGGDGPPCQKRGTGRAVVVSWFWRRSPPRAQAPVHVFGAQSCLVHTCAVSRLSPSRDAPSLDPLSSLCCSSSTRDRWGPGRLATGTVPRCGRSWNSLCRRGQRRGGRGSRGEGWGRACHARGCFGLGPLHPALAPRVVESTEAKTAASAMSQLRFPVVVIFA